MYYVLLVDKRPYYLTPGSRTRQKSHVLIWEDAEALAAYIPHFLCRNESHIWNRQHAFQPTAPISRLPASVCDEVSLFTLSLSWPPADAVYRQSFSRLIARPAAGCSLSANPRRSHGARFRRLDLSVKKGSSFDIPLFSCQ